MNIFIKYVFTVVLFSGSFIHKAIAQQEIKTTDTAIKRQAKNEAEKNIEKFWFILLKTGPKQDFDSATKARLFEGHMANINKLYYDGVLKVAGPFGKNDLTWRGIFIFDCKSKEEAEKMVSTDPAVAAGLFAFDIVPWYGEATGSFKHGKPKKTTD